MKFEEHELLEALHDLIREGEAVAFTDGIETRYFAYKVLNEVMEKHSEWRRLSVAEHLRLLGH